MLNRNKRFRTLLILIFAAAISHAQGPVPVSVEFNGECYTLLRGGEPYYIKGAGGQEYLDLVHAYGGNSIRLWSTKNPQSSGKTVMEILDEAESYGLTVTLGLWVTQPRQNPDFYDDPQKVAAQLETFREDVLQYKDHPALLMWAVGNEVHLNTNDTRVWDAVGDIAAMIKTEDPHHPVTTVTANINATIVGQLKDKVPDLDLLGINAYGNELAGFAQKVRNAGWDLPYFMGEFGPNMHWQVSGTAWGAKFEPEPAAKAATYEMALNAFDNDDCQCMGAYAFKWGWKWERTYSWINLFTPEGIESSVTDVLYEKWKGKHPVNKSPVSGRVVLNGNSSLRSDTLAPGSVNYATAAILDPDNDPLRVKWVLYEEGLSNASGGDAEPTPPLIENFIVENHTDSILFAAPSYGGPFRLYVFVYDTANNVSISNYPFFVNYPEIVFSGDSIGPVADTYARGGTYAGQNFGKEQVMITKTAENDSYSRESYIKFEIGAIETGIKEAFLHLYGEITNPAEIGVYGADGTGWSETSLTWNNRPAAAIQLDKVQIGDNSAAYFTWNVSNYVAEAHAKGAQFITLILKAEKTTEKEIPWNTRESGINIPILGFTRDTTTSVLQLTSGDFIVKSGATKTLEKQHLEVTGNYPEAITYTLVNAPVHGKMLRNNIVISEGAAFKQADINADRIAYRHDGDTAATSDRIIFNVTDPTGASLLQQTFTIMIDQASNVQPFASGTNARVVPNPVQAELHLENLQPGLGDAVCFDILGQRQNLFIPAGTNRYNVSGLTPGLYFIRLGNDRQVITIRFIKQ